ncbi:MAG: L-serine ammonia-lyase [Gammaproteobacteria bacterium GWE2_42_36]|nr:MAG: L-serine ammonia-lyase [Gammaproteobacteria bacterium GWE2_42_36]HCU04849.1 L-serine ammonia-lyase [Coxiellaceae bacterium]
MPLSVFDLFSIGIGPSSSHTMGPMRAARQFMSTLESMNLLDQVETIKIKLYGSLAFTGKGHGTDKAILMGLEGQSPETIDPDLVTPRCEAISAEKAINLFGKKKIPFDLEKSMVYIFSKTLPKHSNGMHFFAYGKKRAILLDKIYYSIGGGFIMTDDPVEIKIRKNISRQKYPFNKAKELFSWCQKQGLRPYQVILENEKVSRTEKEIYAQVEQITQIMHQAIERGCHRSGILPGGLNVKRRAPELYKKLSAMNLEMTDRETSSIAWIQAYAFAVSEENAAGGRVVTAPTNGSAGIIPAVLEYYKKSHPTEATVEKIVEFLLTAGAIGILYKTGASISGAEVGCQGEVGVACSMAAGALTAVLGGDIKQIEKAAEIAMEHHLGLTCDPVKGLVQIPCIERNAIAAVTAVSAAKLTLLESGEHLVSLDDVIATMKQTGHDMQTKYKETSQGGLAVNFTAC